MTRVDVAVPQPLPTGGAGAGSGSRRLPSEASFDEAEAGFLAQLTAVATEEDASGFTARSGDGGEAVIARWWRQQAEVGASPALSADQSGGQTAQVTSAPGDVSGAEIPLPAAPVEPPSEAVEAQTEGDRQPPQAKDPTGPVEATLPLAAAPPVAASPVTVQQVSLAAALPHALPIAPPDPQPAAVPPEPLLPVAKDVPAQATPPVVTVLRTETHFAPVLPVAAMPPTGKPVLGERVGPTEGRKPDQPAEGAKPVLSNPPGQRGRSAEPLLVQTTPDRAQGDASQSQPDADGENPAPMAPLSARGIGHATQPAGAPAQQVADTIAANLSAAETDNTRPAPATAPRPGALQPVKVLTIQLQPADLGTVTVRLRLKADAMDVEVEAGRHATARLIDADRDTLTSLLRSAGYHVEALTVRAVEPASMAASPGPTPGSTDPGPQLQPGGSGPDARASGGRAQPGHHSDTQLPDRNDHDSEQATGERRGAGLYV